MNAGIIQITVNSILLRTKRANQQMNEMMTPYENKLIYICNIFNVSVLK